MSQPGADSIRWIALVAVTGLVSILFVGMVQPFLVALVLAAITAAMSAPLQARMMSLTHGRAGFAAALTLVILCIALVAPLLGVIFLAAQQAQGMSAGAEALVAELQAISPDDPLPDWVPFRDAIGARSADIMAKLGELAGALGGWAASAFGHIAAGTAQFFLDLFVYIYALFLFLQMDRTVISQILSYSGLAEGKQAELEERMVSISRATIKGTLVIGAAQGALGALGFWVAGIEGAAFWGVVMAVLSIIPGLGPLLIIFCGVVWLFTQGAVTPAIGLAVWGVAVVGTIDNILRPILVGRDAALHDILILISTLGGLAMFGAAGLVLGPVLAGLFVSLWNTLSRTAADPDDLRETATPDETGAGAGLLDEDMTRELEDLRRKQAERSGRDGPKNAP